MKKKSRYKPKPVHPDNLAYILQGNLPLTAAATTMTRVKVANHGAMDSLVKGQGLASDLTTLSHMLITATALAKHNLGRDWLPELEAADKVLIEVSRRKSFVLKALEINALNLAIEIHDAQLESCTIKQLEDAVKAAKAAIRHNHEVREVAQ
jgi:hypothetical protein